MGRWNGDRDCQPVELTVVCLLGRKLLAAYRAQNPASVVNPFRGGDLYERPPSIILHGSNRAQQFSPTKMVKALD